MNSEARVIAHSTGGAARSAGPQEDDRSRDRELEQAVEIAFFDPTEKDRLREALPRAGRRLKDAAIELLCALGALVLAAVARWALSRACRRVVEQRGRVNGAELSALALQDLLNRLFYRKLIGPGRLLRAFGAREAVEGEDGAPARSLVLAERTYRSGQRRRGLAFAAAGDAPTVKALLGVRVGPDHIPTWCLRRFLRTKEGVWRELTPGTCEFDTPARTAGAESALLYFFSEPEVPGPGYDLTEPARSSEEAPPEEPAPEQSPPGEEAPEAPPEERPGEQAATLPTDRAPRAA